MLEAVESKPIPYRQNGQGYFRDYPLTDMPRLQDRRDLTIARRSLTAALQTVHDSSRVTRLPMSAVAMT